MLKTTPRVYQANAESEPRAALLALFESEESLLLRYAFSITGRRAVAEEIVQEVFLLLHKNWDEVESPKSWLTRSVRNKAFSFVRDHRREVLTSNDESQPTTTAASESPQQVLLRVEATVKLRELLGQLSESDQRLVTLKYFDDCKYSEISDQTGMSVGNVGYRLHHILKQLAGKLTSLGIDEKS
ncbi:ECF RNA polymerase sigma factor SigL [Rubripirellula amarantea]|uniref:ECF RNA polymerase sigma factor SigL n=1 Tax=Rubripirellula amarantea TaxID=2527999 RepID=A0A5C5WWE2_9BACT|nr:RNA polymerase sigma factor [Rubripirellula amarantea]TWT54898.1 ECF RNA polymerase sigma factor SigL [Rubripirellula amarantea]